MADEDKDSKTEEPTAKKLEQSREQGQVAQSQEVKSFMILLGALLVVGATGPWLSGKISLILRTILENSAFIQLGIEDLQVLSLDLFFSVTLLFLLPFGVFVVMAILGSLMQFGFVWSPKALELKFNKINPLSGAKRLFSKRTVVEGAKTMMKLFVVGGAIWLLLSPHFESPETFMGRDIAVTLSELNDLLVLLLIAAVVVVAVIAAADFIYQRYQFTEDQKMTKQEIKDEHKNMEGDPHVKARIRSLRIQRSRERMMASVPTASVVITNPTHYAVALKYDMDKMAAPILVAKGSDFIALRIREAAEEHDVPIVENPPLARALYASVDLDREVPPEHYKAVAEVIGYVMRLSKDKEKKNKKPSAIEGDPRDDGLF